MLLLAVLVTIGPSAFNKFILVWYEGDFEDGSGPWLPNSNS